MNPVHLHLVLNHLPVVGTAFTLALLVFALWKKSEELKRTALLFFVLVALLTVPAYLSGEPSEDFLMENVNADMEFIEPHEDAAGWAFGAQIALGIVALAGLLIFRGGKTLPTPFSGAVLALALVVFALMARTANLGGEIRHPEIRAVQAAPAETSHTGER